MVSGLIRPGGKRFLFFFVVLLLLLSILLGIVFFLFTISLYLGSWTGSTILGLFLLSENVSCLLNSRFTATTPDITICFFPCRFSIASNVTVSTPSVFYLSQSCYLLRLQKCSIYDYFFFGFNKSSFSFLVLIQRSHRMQKQKEDLNSRRLLPASPFCVRVLFLVHIPSLCVSLTLQS